MKKYRVVLLEGHKAKADQIIDGCLGNVFDDGKVALYDRGDAIKKARMFGGKIVEAQGLHSVIGKLSIQTIPENALLFGVTKLLNGREAFKDATDNDERMYHGDIFETLANEIDQFSEIERVHLFGTPKKVIDQLEELAKLISADYVLITLS